VIDLNRRLCHLERLIFGVYETFVSMVRAAPLPITPQPESLFSARPWICTTDEGS